jgi:hypothetical protein
MPNTVVLSCRRVAAAVLLTAAASSQAAAQIGVPSAGGERPFQPRFGVGYVANLPEQMAGVSVHVVPRGLPGGIGLYADAKFDVESPVDEEGFTEGLTAREVDEVSGDRLLSTDDSFTSINVGLMRPITAGLVAYLGAGYANGTRYKEYIDPDNELGRGGIYWVEDPDNKPSNLNVTGGLFFQMGGSFAFQMGADSNPGGFSLGISYLTPLR